MQPENGLWRIAILGAESSGKSTLASGLAAHYRTIWVPEYLREFVDAHGRTPHEHEQMDIALTQARHEEDAMGLAREFLFCDTTPMMTALYSRFYWGRVDAQLAALAHERHYHMTLVAAPDIPWVADGLQRESDAVRQAIYAMLLAMLEDRGTAYEIVRGDAAQRLAAAIAILDNAGR